MDFIRLIGKTNQDGLRIEDIRRIGVTDHYVALVKNIHSGERMWLSVNDTIKLLNSISRDKKDIT